MQNIIYVYNDKNSFGYDKIYYQDIFDEEDNLLRYEDCDFLNICVCSVDKFLFDTQISIFSVFRDSKYFFSITKIPWSSDVITDTLSFKVELTKFLKEYFMVKFKMIKSHADYILFYFRHNLINSIKIELYKNTNVIVKQVRFYKKYCSGDIWFVDLASSNDNCRNRNNPSTLKSKDNFIVTRGNISIEKKNLEVFKDLMEIIKSSYVRSNTSLFFLFIIEKLSLDVFLYTVKFCIPENKYKKIYFFYRISRSLQNLNYDTLSFYYLNNAIECLGNTLSLELTEYLVRKNFESVDKRNWKIEIKNILGSLMNEEQWLLSEIENTKPDFNAETDILDAEIKSNNVIWKRSISLEKIHRKDHFKIYNLKSDENYFSDKIMIKLSFLNRNSIYLEGIECQFEGSLENFIVPVHKELKLGANELYFCIKTKYQKKKTFFNKENTGTKDVMLRNPQSIVFKRLILQSNKSYSLKNIKMVYLSKENNFKILNILKDVKYDVYILQFDKETKIIGSLIFNVSNLHYVFFEKEEKKRFISYELCDGYFEKIEL